MAHRANVTISRLSSSLSIVSVPRARVDELSHPILRLLLQPNPSFLSITANLIELSIFVEAENAAPFHAIARADQASRPLDAVQVSDERWAVLQIETHNQLDDTGARVSELSAPLAAAGISILYQSSYMSDFIFVKERRLAEVMSLFAIAGFALYAADPNLLTASFAPPTASTRERSGSAPLPSTSTSRSSSKSTTGRASSTGQGKAKAASKSATGLSVPLPDVRVLPAPDLACVGLVDEVADQWALKIVKLISFPDLIPAPAPPPTLVHPLERKPTSPVAEVDESSTKDDGYFSHSPSPTLEAKPDSTSEEPEVVPRSPSREVPSLLEPLPAPINWPEAEVKQLSEEPQALETDAAASLTPEIQHAIPFFSFTRTPEGSSLTAGARVLATLFSPAERHMVISGGELDAFDREIEENKLGNYSPTSSAFASVPSSPITGPGFGSFSVGAAEDASDEDDDEEDGHPLLSALQVDLRSAGLDTHGLVHRFSRALARGGVNHMYASTLWSANLLVPTGRHGRGARRASSLLREC
ncbi:ACT-7 domain-containing protein [Mycena kentingensis (nom. inval.)]|nr:ACT-7 domain-containing protein [Mycena kentingensis (nom. inval.)]